MEEKEITIYQYVLTVYHDVIAETPFFYSIEDLDRWCNLNDFEHTELNTNTIISFI